MYGGLEKPLYSGNMKSLREMAKVAEELTNDTDTAPSTVVPGAADDGVGTNQENVGDISNLDPVGGWSYDYDIAAPNSASPTRTLRTRRRCTSLRNATTMAITTT